MNESIQKQTAVNDQQIKELSQKTGNKQLLKFQQTNFPDGGMIHRLHVPNLLMSVRYLIKRHSIIFDSMRILSLLVEDIPDIDS